MDLKVRSATYYEGRPPLYNLPLEMGCFSMNSNSKYRDDSHQMKYLSMPEKLKDLNMDLNEGYSDYIHVHEDTENTFSAILKWIVSHEKEVRKHFTDRFSPNTKIDFVCFRGLLTSVCSTIYEKTEEWMIYATKFRSVIYLCDMQTEQHVQKEEMLGEKGQLMSSWGFKFEQFMTSDTMNSKPNTSIPVNENEKYFSVMKGKLGDHRILFSAEVDGVDPDHLMASGQDLTSVLRYIELKTSRIITSDRQKRNFLRFKLIKWYLQSFLAGIPRVICGFRDDSGIVRKLNIFNVRDMPHLAGDLWSSNACLNFCSHFLNYVKQCMQKDDPRVVYKFYWKPYSDVTCEELSSEYQVLPDWYIEKVKVI